MNVEFLDAYSKEETLFNMSVAGWDKLENHPQFTAIMDWYLPQVDLVHWTDLLDDLVEEAKDKAVENGDDDAGVYDDDFDDFGYRHDLVASKYHVFDTKIKNYDMIIEK